MDFDQFIGGFNEDILENLAVGAYEPAMESTVCYESDEKHMERENKRERCGNTTTKYAEQTKNKTCRPEQQQNI